MAKKLPKKERVNQIIDSAVEVFLDVGYDAASVDMIANTMGISKGGIYHHFSSKDEILISANDRFMEPVFAYIIQADQQKDKALALRQYIAAYMSHWKNHPRELMFTFLSLTKIMNIPEFHGEMNKHASMMMDIYQGWYDKGVEDGVFKPGDTKGYAVTLMSALDGITTYLLLEDQFPLEETIKRFQTVYVDLLLSDSYKGGSYE